MKNIETLLNERAELWELILSTEFNHRYHPTPTTQKSMARAVANLKKFDDKINKILGV